MQFTSLELRNALMYVLALVMSVAVHEFGHAFVADKLGDRLARSQGRVTLNPLAHIDPIGTLLIPLFGALFQMPILGWGRPVEHSLSARWVPRWMSMRTALLLVSIAGPAMNILLAVVLGLPFVALLSTGRADAAMLVAYMITMNVGLAIFNLIPFPPLDGRSLLLWFLDEDSSIARALHRFGPLLFLLLLMTGAFRIVMIPARFLSGYWLSFLAHLAQ